MLCKYCPLLFTPQGQSVVGKEKYTLSVNPIVSGHDNVRVRLLSVIQREKNLFRLQPVVCERKLLDYMPSNLIREDVILIYENGLLQTDKS